MPRAPERDIMEDWIIVQPCPKCGLKRLAIGNAVYYTAPLQHPYSCTNGDCGMSGKFGYDGWSEKKIVIHLPSEAEKEAEKEMGGVIDLIRTHGDMSKLPEVDLELESTPVVPKQHRLIPRAWIDDGLNQVTWERYGLRYGAAFSTALRTHVHTPDARENPHVKGSPDHRGWEDGWHFEERGLPRWPDEDN